MSGIECESNGDCDNGDIAQICGNNKVCVCFGGTGFLGENCDEPTAQTRFNQAGNLSQTLIAICLMIWGIFVARKLYVVSREELRHKAGIEKKKSQNRYRKLNYVAGFTMASGFWFFLYALFQTILAFNPQLGSAIELLSVNGNNKNFSVIVPPGGIFAQFSIAMGFLSVVSASVAIALSLIEVAESMKEFLLHYKFVNFVGYFKKCAFVFLFILYVLKLSLTLATQVQITQLIAVCILFFLGTLFLCGRITFVNTLKELSTATRDRSNKPIRLVTITASIHAFFNTAMAISATCEFALFPTAGDIEPGSFNRQVFLTDFFILCALALVACDIWYLQSILTNIEEATTKDTATTKDETVESAL